MTTKLPSVRNFLLLVLALTVSGMTVGAWISGKMEALKNYKEPSYGLKVTPFPTKIEP